VALTCRESASDQRPERSVLVLGSAMETLGPEAQAEKPSETAKTTNNILKYFFINTTPP
jgi:hypothetical protein